MAQILFAIYEPPEKGMPFLAVKIEGVKTKYKKVSAIAVRSRADAEQALEIQKKDFDNPYWRDQEAMTAHYGPKNDEGKK